MATLRYLLSKTTPKALSHSLSTCRFTHSSINRGINPSYSLRRGLHSFFSREFNSHCRNFSTASDYAAQDSDSSVGAALNLDDRVPATVITGFLGSGKVRKKEEKIELKHVKKQMIFMRMGVCSKLFVGFLLPSSFSLLLWQQMFCVQLLHMFTFLVPGNILVISF